MTGRPREILFVDPDIRDPRILLDGLVRPVAVVRLKRNLDPLRQVASALAGARGIEALHFLCHGAPGALRLAGRMIGTETLRASGNLLKVVRAALADDAAIGLYACSVCVGEAGASFVDTLSLALDARVEAASERLGPGAGPEAGWQSFDPAFLPFDPHRIESYPHVLVADTVSGASFDTTDGTNLTNASIFADGDDTLYIDNPTYIAGSTIDGGGGTDTLQLDGSVDVSGTTLTSFESLLVKNSNPFAASAAATVSAAQHNAFAEIADAGLRFGIPIEQTITLGAGTEAVTGSSAIEAYVLSDNYTGTFTLGAATQKITGNSGDNTIVVSDMTPTQPASIDGGAGHDTLVLSGTVSLVTIYQSDGISSIESITLGDGANVTMLSPLHDLIGSAPGTNTIVLPNDEATPFSAHADVENYVLTSSFSPTIVVQAGTNVTGQDGDDTVDVGGLTVTGTYDLGGGTSNVVKAADGADISGVNGGGATTAQYLSLSGSVTMTVAQHNGASVQGISGSDTVVLADAGTVTGSTETGGFTVEAYVLADGSNDFTLGTANQSVTGGSGADTVTVGAFEVTGTLAGGTGTDTLVMSAGADLSGAAVSGFEAFALSGSGSFSIPELASGQTIELTGVTGLTAANVRLNGSNLEIDTDATDFGSVETTFATGGDLSSVVVGSVTESNGNTYITLGAPNTAPAIGGAASGQAVDDTATVAPFSAVTIEDADGDDVTVSVQLDTAGNGAFTAASLTASGFTETSAGVYGLAATDPASAQAAIRQLAFDPADNRVVPESIETTTFTITVNDGSETASSSTTTVVSTSINDAPAVTSGGTASFAENAAGTVYTVAATDADTGQTLTYGLGGTDASLFDIDASTGAVSFKSAPDFEAPADDSGDNVYDIEVTASDGTATSAARAVAITVTGVDEDPVFSSGTTATAAENATATGYTATAADPEGAAVTYSLTGGADQAAFSVDADSGALSFASPQDFENPSDADGNGSYVVQVTATDQTGNTASQDVTVSLTDADEAPSVTSATTASFAENGTGTAYTVTGSDPDAGASLTYAISGGADAGLFDIDASTGAVSFKTTPDFETPTDDGDDNVYDIEVTANDGTSTSSALAVAITVTDANEAPSVTSGATASVAENAGSTAYTVTGSDPDAGASLSYAISGGADAGLFDIDASTGAVSFKTTPDFEAPADDGGDNVYDIEVTANDGTATSAARAVAITVTDANDSPSVTSGAAASVAESAGGTVYTVTGSDQDAGASLSFAISGGADAGLFDIDAATGAVSFKAAPDFEAPADDGGDNVYDIEVTASDGTNTSSALAVAITVTGVDEDPVFSSGTTAAAAENATATGYTAAAGDPEGATVTYSLTGGADQAAFSIDADSGALSFTSPQDFENPGDTDGNGSYLVQVAATDQTGNTATQDVTVSLTDANEVPSVNSGATASVAENAGGTAYTVTGSDPDAGASLTYAISGGVDASLFDIDAGTGAVTFKAAPDFEAPADDGADNVYDIEVAANDGTNTSSAQAVAITVTDANEAPSVTSGATASVAENTSGTVYAITASDPDASANLSYAISGGADASLLDVDAGTGAVSFKTTPDFEAPADDGGDNVYDIEVTASDGTNTSSAQAVAITVTGVDEDPVFSSGTTATAAENATATGYTASAADPEGATATYSLTGGADQAAFSINSSSGALSFTAPQDFENPSDADGNGSYLVQVTATDQTGNTASQDVTVSLTDAEEAPSVTSGATASFAENGTGTAYTVTGSDPDAGASLSYAISGGVDASLFDIDAGTGAVTFKTAPDFETPADDSSNNVYDIEVTANDGTSTSSAQAIAITVTDANEAPSVTSSETTSVAESAGGTVYTVTGSDQDAGASLSFAISGGADAGLFDIDASTGAVSFKTAPDFEVPADDGGDNVYDIEVTANDGTATSAARAVAITVTDANEAPSVTSGPAVSVAENAGGTVYTVTGSDPDTGASLSYVISGGTDASLFDIDTGTGAVSFKAAPDFEAPADDSRDNVYDIEVTVGDGTNTSTVRAVAITVTDANEEPSVTSGATASAAENTVASVYTVTGSDPDAGASLSFAISGGADAGLFDIEAATGAVTFKAAPDFEAPADDGGDNVYDIEVTANDGTSTSSAQAVAITVTGIDEAPSVTSPATASAPENTGGTVYAVTGADPEAGTTLTFAISGGADASLFDIDAVTGTVTFKVAPDFEAPADDGGDNVYDIQVTADDGSSTSPSKAVAIAVTDVNEAPVIANLDGDTLRYDRSGHPNRLDAGTAATLSDDSSDFDGGSLTVVISAGGYETEDILTFDTTDVTLSGKTAGSTVTVGGTLIGTLRNAITAGSDLVVDLGGNADAGTVQILLQSIAYQNINTGSPTEGIRTIQATVNDGGLDSTVTLTATVPPPPSSGVGGGGGSPGSGIVVTPTTPTATVGGSAATAAQVISNTGTARGNAPIVENTNNNGNVVTATLPSSTAITSEGPSLAQSGEEALTTLVNAVDARNSTAEADLISGARTFLTNLASATTLDVRTIVPTTTQSSLSEPIVITGTTPSAGNSQSEAFVIDLRQLPGGSTLQLDNIEFASVLGSATVTGGAGDNYVTGDDMSQFISLGVGDDTLYGGDGSDTIGSGAGADILYGDAGHDTVFGGTDGDTLFGGRDQDVVYGNQESDVLYGNQGLDTLYGGQDADVAYGGQHEDIVYGNLGDDVLYGNLGADILYGGQGDDLLYGGQSEGSYLPGSTQELLVGGSGNDTLMGGRGDDLLSGGDGTDVFVIGEYDGNDVVTDFDGDAGDKVQIVTSDGGTVVDSYAELVATSRATEEGVRIALGAGTSMTLRGIAQSQLQSDWFGFT